MRTKPYFKADQAVQDKNLILFMKTDRLLLQNQLHFIKTVIKACKGELKYCSCEFSKVREGFLYCFSMTQCVCNGLTLFPDTFGPEVSIFFLPVHITKGIWSQTQQRTFRHLRWNLGGI